MLVQLMLEIMQFALVVLEKLLLVLVILDMHIDHIIHHHLAKSVIIINIITSIHIDSNWCLITFHHQTDQNQSIALSFINFNSI